jgi:putative tricarboxylic transport membrane protein
MRGVDHDFTVNNNRVVDQIFNTFWILFGIGICIQSIRHQLWSPAGPGSGFIPFLTGLLIGVTGLLLYLSESSKGSKKEERGKFWENPIAVRKVFYLVGSLCIMALIMLKLGFLLTSILVTILMIRVIEPKKWMMVIFTSIGSCALIYSLFQFLMQIKLPKGFLGF